MSHQQAHHSPAAQPPVGHSLLKRTGSAYERDLGVRDVSAARGSEAEELVDGDCDGGIFEVGGTRGGRRKAERVMQLLRERIN
jgi:hypothetical protein